MKGVAWRARGLIAARMSEPFAITGAYAAGGTNTQITENSRHTVAVDATNPSVVFHNTRNGTDGPAFTVKCGVWAATTFGTGPTPIQYKPMTWPGGSDSFRRSASIAPGAFAESDAVALTGLSAGNLLMTRQYEIFASAPANWLGNELSVYQGDETGAVGTSVTDTVNAYSDYGGGTYYGYPSGGGTYQLSSPSLILGDSATRKARIILANDSIGMGSGEGAGGLFIGWPQRLLASSYPWFLIGQQGFSLQSLISESAKRLALADLSGASHVLLQVITNDLPAAAPAATVVSDFLARMATLQATLDALPLKPRLIPCTSTPRTNPANNAKFSSDQSTTQAARLLLNQAIRDNNGVGYGYLDVALYSQSAGDANLWDNTAGRGSADGIHPNQATHIYIAAQLATQATAVLTVGHYT